MPRRLLPTDLRDQQVTHPENRIDISRIGVPYNGSANNTNIPPYFQQTPLQKYTTTSSTTPANQKFYPYDASAINQHTFSLQCQYNNCKVHAVPGSICDAKEQITAASNVFYMNPFVGEGQILATKDKELCSISDATKESSHVRFDRRKRIPTPIYKNGNKNGKRQKGIQSNDDPTFVTTSNVPQEFHDNFKNNSDSAANDQNQGFSSTKGKSILTDSYDSTFANASFFADANNVTSSSYPHTSYSNSASQNNHQFNSCSSNGHVNIAPSASYNEAPSNVFYMNPFVGEGQILATKDKELCSISDATKESSHVRFDRRKRIPTPIYKNGNKNGKRQKGIQSNDDPTFVTTSNVPQEFHDNFKNNSDSAANDQNQGFSSTKGKSILTDSYDSTFANASYFANANNVTSSSYPHTSYSNSTVQNNHQFNSYSSNGHVNSTPSASYNEGVSHLYIDIGDCHYTCQYCKAAFWYGERLKTGSRWQPIKYNKCCGGGQVYLEKELDPPMFFKQIFKDKNFLENIRAYNQMFSMTSFGAQIDDKINDGRGPYVFKISGQIHHWIGTICPTNINEPKFMQLYIYDTENEVANRMKCFGGKEHSNLKPEITEFNELVQVFRTAREKFNDPNVTEFKIQLYNVVGNRQYQLPSSGTLGAIVFESGSNSQTNYDVIVEYKDRGPQRINKLHTSYMSLQFPLLFVYGQPGYNTQMTLKEVNTKRKRNKLSMNMYYKYQLHERFDQYGLLFKAGRLFQQYVVSVYCALEQERLDFMRSNQKKLRSECLSGICDAISKGDHFGSHVGKKIILPSSFTGGPRYMYSHYLDALAICRVLGNPQYFITFTCNVNWPEIKRHMKRYPEISQSDRPDVVCRVFQEKLNDFLKVLKEGHIFGRCTGVLYTIEFQKRGLPHCHTLLWIDARDKIRDPDQIDNFISAELPDKASDPEAYKVVADMMMHGPCGNAKPKAPCMQEGLCTKNFPKKYTEKTYFDKDGHVHYRRRRTPAYVQRGEVKLDNNYVVPYNRLLCLMFHAHINVEYCGLSMLIKYLFKYISKGTDPIAARIVKPIGTSESSSSVPNIQIDEIQNFIDGHFLCPHECCWRILDFPIHHREPPVQILAVHLQDMQEITFGEQETLANVLTDDGRKVTTLTEWFTYNTLFIDGKHLTYLDFPSEYVWYEEAKAWRRRKIKTKHSIGRLVYVHPAAGELFYFRMLLAHQKGCKSFIELRTVNNHTFPTYRAACQAMGLLDDDKEWDIALEEASMTATASQLRTLFCHILIYCEVSDPLQLWEKHWRLMADDIPRKASETSNVNNLHVNDPELKNYIMYELQVILNGCSRSLEDYSFSLPPEHLIQQLHNRLLMEERNYNREELKEEVAR